MLPVPRDGMASVLAGPCCHQQSHRCGFSKVSVTTVPALGSWCHREATDRWPLGRQSPSVSSQGPTAGAGRRLGSEGDGVVTPREGGKGGDLPPNDSNLKNQNETILLYDTLPMTDT